MPSAVARAARIAPRFTSRGRGVVLGRGTGFSRLARGRPLGCIAASSRHVPHKPGPVCPLSNPHARPVEGGGLNSSPELTAYTPTSPNPSSTEELVLAPRLHSRAPGRHRHRFWPSSGKERRPACLVRVDWKGRFEARFVLRCFQVLSLAAWLPGTVPCRTTGTLEAAAQCSSRTDRTLLSPFPQSRQVESDLSHDGLNPAHVPF